MRKLRTVLFGVLLCGLISASASADTITLTTGKTWVGTYKNSGPGGFVDIYKYAPKGNYDTGNSIRLVYHIVVELGDTVPAPFTPTTPQTLPSNPANGTPLLFINAPFTISLPTAPNSPWDISPNIFTVSFQRTPGVGTRAMRADLQQNNTIGTGFSSVVVAISGL